MHAVLDRDQVMQAAAQHLRLVTCFTLEGNKAALNRALAELLLDNANAVVRNVADARKQ